MAKSNGNTISNIKEDADRLGKSRPQTQQGHHRISALRTAAPPAHQTMAPAVDLPTRQMLQEASSHKSFQNAEIVASYRRQQHHLQKRQKNMNMIL